MRRSVSSRASSRTVSLLGCSCACGALLLAGCASGPVAPTGSGTSTSPAPTSSSASVASPTTSPATPTPSTTTSPPPTSPSSSATPSTSPSAPAVRTRVTLVVTGCEGCRVVAERDGTRAAPLDRPTQIWATVKHGVATVVMPTSWTRGTHFGVACTAPGACQAPASPVVALRYAGVPLGAELTWAQAQHHGSASACWAGTTRATARLVLTVRLTTTHAGMATVPWVVAWASPQVAVVPGTWEPTDRGGLATQDVVLC